MWETSWSFMNNIFSVSHTSHTLRYWQWGEFLDWAEALQSAKASDSPYSAWTTVREWQRCCLVHLLFAHKCEGTGGQSCSSVHSPSLYNKKKGSIWLVILLPGPFFCHSNGDLKSRSRAWLSSPFLHLKTRVSSTRSLGVLSSITWKASIS